MLQNPYTFSFANAPTAVDVATYGLGQPTSAYAHAAGNVLCVLLPRLVSFDLNTNDDIEAFNWREFEEISYFGKNKIFISFFIRSLTNDDQSIYEHMPRKQCQFGSGESSRFVDSCRNAQCGRGRTTRLSFIKCSYDVTGCACIEFGRKCEYYL